MGAERSRQEANENGERQQMVAILNEKSRENSKLKKEIGQLLERVAVEERNHEDQLSSISKEKIEKEELSKATVQKLSQLIRDKDLELESLRERNTSLVKIVESENKFDEPIQKLSQLKNDKDRKRSMSESTKNNKIATEEGTAEPANCINESLRSELEAANGQLMKKEKEREDLV